MPNLASYYKSTAAQRPGEVPAADWAGGVNNGASCAPGIGVNTGDYSPKPQDWSEEERAPADSAQIGQSGVDATTLELFNVVTGDDNNQPVFVQADGVTAPGAVLDVGTGAVNLTGKTVPAGAWVWGSVPIA